LGGGGWRAAESGFRKSGERVLLKILKNALELLINVSAAILLAWVVMLVKLVKDGSVDFFSGWEKGETVF